MKKILKTIVSGALALLILAPASPVCAAPGDKPMLYLLSENYESSLYNETLAGDYWIDLKNVDITDKDGTWSGLFPEYLPTPLETANKDIPFNPQNSENQFPVSGVVDSTEAYWPESHVVAFRYGYAAGYDVPQGELDSSERQGAHKWSDQPISNAVNPFAFKENDLLTKEEWSSPQTNLIVYGDLKATGSQDSTAIGEASPGEGFSLDFSLDASWVRRYLNGLILAATRVGGNFPSQSTGPDFIHPDVISYKNGNVRTDSQLVFTLDIPSGVVVSDTASAVLSGLDGFGNPTIKKSTDGKALIITITKNNPGAEVSLQSVVDALKNVGTRSINIQIKGLSVDPSAQIGDQVSLRGTAAGYYDLTLPKVAPVHVYNWFAAQQSATGLNQAEDASKPKQISYSFKVVPPKPSPDPTTGGSEGQSSESSALRIIKVDGTGKAISAPVTFSLKNTNGIFQPRTATTNEHGIAELSTPMAGTYTLTEIKTPEGYIPLEKPMKVTIDSQGRASVDGSAPTKTLFIVNETVKPVNDPVAPITGDTRFDVAVNLSKTYFGDARKVIIVQDQAYADSMSAMNISQGQIPILYTKQDELSAVTREEILRTGRDELIVVGGPNTISPKVFNQLQALKHGKVTRVGGADRFEVNVNSVKYMDHPTTAVIASGWIYTDALSSVPFAYQQKAPVVLVGTDSVPAVIREMLDKDYTDATLVGGPVTVSEKAEAELESILGTDIERIGGADRYAVSATVGARVGKTENAIVTSGELWSDALIAGPLAQKLPAPVLLTRAAGLPEPISATIAGNTALKRVIVIGGPVSIGGQVRADLRALLLPEEAPAQ